MWFFLQTYVITSRYLLYDMSQLAERLLSKRPRNLPANWIWSDQRKHKLSLIAKGTLENWKSHRCWIYASPLVITNDHEQKPNISWICRFMLVIIDNNIDGLLQDCSISNALAMELLQSCTKLVTYPFVTGTNSWKYSDEKSAAKQSGKWLMCCDSAKPEKKFGW